MGGPFELGSCHHRRPTGPWLQHSLVFAVECFNFLQNLDDAGAALNGIVEMKNEMWRIFHSDMPGKLRLQCHTMGREFVQNTLSAV